MKRHACLVDFYELEKLMNYEFNLLPKMVKRHPKNMADVDCYKYDFQSLDGIYESITKLNYTIKKLK